jgi:hypothetical protein
VPHLLEELDDITTAVQHVRSRLRPLVRGWDRLSEAAARDLPGDARLAWDAIVVAYEESDRSANGERYYGPESASATFCRLQGARNFGGVASGGHLRAWMERDQEERPEWWHRLQRELRQKGASEPWTDADRSARLTAPRWKDLPLALDDERLERLRVLSEWSTKAPWHRTRMTRADWNELAAAVPQLTQEIRLNVSRQHRLEAALPGVAVLKARCPATRVPVGGSGGRRISTNVSDRLVTLDVSHRPVREMEMPLSAVADELQEMFARRPASRDREAISLPAPLARRVQRSLPEIGL